MNWRWNGTLFFNLTEKRLLELLISRKEKKLKLLEANINAVKAKLVPLEGSVEFKDKMTHLQDFVGTVDKETQKKKKKNMRDTNGYKTNKVYKWQDAIEAEEGTSLTSKEEEREPIPPKPRGGLPTRAQRGHPGNNYRGDFQRRGYGGPLGEGGGLLSLEGEGEVSIPRRMGEGNGDPGTLWHPPDHME